MHIEVRRFNELTITALYEILQLRSEIFVVEQDCVYQDLDGKDQKALHVIGKKNDKVIAYTRVFGAGDYFDFPSIGRVVVAKEERQFGYGKVIMDASIKAVKEHLEESTIKISAQTYLKKFYNDLGFKEYGETYLEDGIPHIAMLRK